jgi:hypothetical protein
VNEEEADSLCSECGEYWRVFTNNPKRRCGMQNSCWYPIGSIHVENEVEICV